MVKNATNAVTPATNNNTKPKTTRPERIVRDIGKCRLEEIEDVARRLVEAGRGNIVHGALAHAANQAMAARMGNTVPQVSNSSPLGERTLRLGSLELPVNLS